MVDILTRPFFLVILCSAGYALATYAMKTASHSPALPVLVAITICLAASVIAEVILLRNHTIGVIYIAIIATESLLVVTFAFALGEGLNLKQLLGAAMVLAGAIVVTT